MQATAGIANGRLEQDADGQALAFDLSRTGDRSTYGEIRVTKPGSSEPVMVARGIAVYPEVDQRTVSLPVPPEVAAQLKGRYRWNITSPRIPAADLSPEPTWF